MGCNRRGAHPHARVRIRRVAVGVREVKESVERIRPAFSSEKIESSKVSCHSLGGVAKIISTGLYGDWVDWAPTRPFGLLSGWGTG